MADKGYAETETGAVQQTMEAYRNNGLEYADEGR